MEGINELELRTLLKSGLSGDQLTTAIIKAILDESLPWEEKRPFWHLLFTSGRNATLAHALAQCLKAKLRIPFDLLVQVTRQARLKPMPIVVEALLKGARKQKALDELIGPTGWDRYDSRFGELREKLLSEKAKIHLSYKESLLEKFQFLQSQRMQEQAARVLRRMVELFPEEEEFKKLKNQFEEQWARDVLANHMASANLEKLDYTQTTPSTKDEEMLNCFAMEGEKIALEHREFAADLSIAFWFMEDYQRGLEALAWAEPSQANDWLRAEMLFEARRFIEALEHSNHFEIKYVEDPETTFSVSYMRAQCLRGSGQLTAALEILQGIVRVRPNYRSVNSLLQEWTEGAFWE